MATPLNIQAATPFHIYQLAKSMRPEDVAECDASMGLDPLNSLIASVSGSDYAKALVIDGEVAVIWGVAPSPAPLGGPVLGLAWALTGAIVNRRPKEFLRACRPAIREMLKHYDALTNVVDARYEAALRWAEWLGFDVQPPRPFGPQGLPFRQIFLRRDSWVH